MRIPPGASISAFLKRDVVRHNGPITPARAREFLVAKEASLLVTTVKGKTGSLYLEGNKDPFLSPQGEKEEGVLQIDTYVKAAETDTLESVMDVLKEGTLLLALDREEKPAGYLTRAMVLPALVADWVETRRLLPVLLESSGEIITIADRRHTVLYWNQKAETFYGIKKKEILGKDLRSFFSNLILSQVLETGKPVTEAYHQPKPGLYVLINSQPVELDGTLLGAISLERDITEMVNLNRELNKTTTHLNLLQREMDQLEKRAEGPFASIYGHSPPLRECLDMARKVAATRAAVLIRGESGTGKELFARAIHQAGIRKARPFIAINCGAIPSNLFESELFGYEPGAFTGAEKRGKEGRFELADGGTLFLDEIGEMDFAMQVKLLRVLQDNIFFRVGGTKPVKVDVRIIAATNKDLEHMMGQGQFRRDLYYRLNVVSLEIPPLRSRKGDIPELVYLFINEFSRLHGKEINDVPPDLMTAFLKYSWPGNLRELRNVIERLVVLTEGPALDQRFLPADIFPGAAENPLVHEEATALADITSQVERKTIQKALGAYQGNKSKAARSLGIPRSTFYYKLKKLGLEDHPGS